MLLLLVVGCSKQNNIKILKLGHGLDPTHSVHKAMVFMADQLAKKSNHTLRMDIYPSSQLGAERDLIELLQIGSLAMTKVSSAPMEPFVPEMKIFGTPYVFRDSNHFWKVLKSEIGKKLLLSGEKYFLRGMGYYDAGSRSFYTKDKPIEKPSDLKGLKIRVQKSITAVSMVETMGGSATPIPFGELYSALQQGVVDGAENNAPSFYYTGHYEVCKYYSLDEHTVLPDVLLMSTKIWNTLSSQQQQWVQESVDESVDYQRKLWKESEEESLQAVKKAGVKIIYPDKKLFQQSVKPMVEKLKGTALYELIQQIQAVSSMGE